MKTMFVLGVGLAFLVTCASQEPLPKNTYRVALVQFDTVPEQNERNVREIERLSQEAVARGAEIIMFHESSVTDYISDMEQYSEYVPEGPSCRKIEALAKELQTYIAFGLSEKTRDHRYYITYVFMGPRGFVYKYRKTWIFQTPNNDNSRYRNEWAHYDPGTGPEIFNLAGLRATCFICSDGGAPRCIERATLLEPDIVFYPNNRKSYLGNHPAFMAYAVQIGAPMLIANRIGRSWHAEYKGGCSVISNTGEMLANTDSTAQEEILVYDLEIKKSGR